MENDKLEMEPVVTPEMKDIGGDIIQGAFESRDNGNYANADSVAEAVYIAMSRIRGVEHRRIPSGTQGRF